MTTRFRRPMLMLGTTILIMQAVFMPVGMVYAETTMDTEEQELMELPPMKNYLEEEQISDPRFFFTRSRMQGTVEEPLQVTFFSDQEVSEARVFLPEEATLLKDQLPTGISVEEGAQPNEWLVQSKRAQKTFVLPLVVKQVGNYELSVEETTAHLEISEKEETSEEVPVEETELSDEDQAGQEELNEENGREEEQENEQPADEVREPVSEAPQEQQTDEEETDEESQVVEPTVFDGETAEVATMAEFRGAVGNPDIGIISVQANLTEATANVLTVDRPLLIQGNGYTLTFGINGFYFQLEEVTQASTIRLENATLTKVGVTPLINATVENSKNWTIELEDITEVNANTMRLASLPEGSIHFTGGVSNFTRTASAQTFIEAKEVLATNQAEVTISRGNATVFFSSATVADPKLTVEQGATVTITTTAGVANTIDLRGENPEIALQNGGLSVSTIGPATATTPTDTTNNAVVLSGIFPKITVHQDSLFTVRTTLTKRGIHLVGDNAQLEVNNSNLSVVSATQAALNIAGESPRLVLDSSNINITSTTGQRINLIGANPLLSLASTEMIMNASTGRGIYLQGITPQVKLDNSQLLVTDTGASQGMILQGTDALLSLSNKSELSITGAGTGALENIQIGNNNARPELSITGESKVSVTTTSGTGAATDTANNAIHLRGADPKATVTSRSELVVSITSNARRGVYLNGDNANLSVTDSLFDVTTVSGQTLNLTGTSPKMTLNKSSARVVSTTGVSMTLSGSDAVLEANESELSIQSTTGQRMNLIGSNPVLNLENSQLDMKATTGRGIYLLGATPQVLLDNSQLLMTDTGASQGMILQGTDALLSLSNKSELSITGAGTGALENIQIGNNNARPELSITGESKVSVTTTSGTGAATDTANNAIHLRGADPKATVTSGSELVVSITSNARRGVYLNGDNPELLVTDSQFDVTTVSGQTLNLTGTSPKMTMNKSQAGIVSTTGQRMNLIGSNPVLNLKNSQLDMSATTGRGVYLQGTKPQVLMENSQLLMTDTGASQGMILQGTDSLLSLINKSELSITGAGTGALENIQIGNNNDRPELSVTGESKLSVTTTSGTGAATDTTNNAIHLRGSDPKATISGGSELEISVTSNARRGIFLNGANAELTVNESQFDVTTISGQALNLLGISPRMTLNKSRSKIVSTTGTGVSLNGNNSTLSVESESVFDVSVGISTAIEILGDAPKLSVSGNGTELKAISNADSRNTHQATIFIGMRGSGSSNAEIDLRNGAKVEVIAGNNAPAMGIYSQGGTFSVVDKAEVNLKNGVAGAATGGSAATLRFISSGSYTFLIDNSILKISKDGGGAPGVRMFGGNNEIYIQNNGKFIVNNPGNGTPNNGGSGLGNQAVHYLGGTGTGNLFSVQGIGSEVSFFAENGPGIDMDTGSGTVTVEDLGYFSVTGRTSTAAGGIFNAGLLTVNFKNPLFMDFRNTRSGGGNIFNVNNGSTLQALNSDLSVWRNDSDLDGDPDMNFSTLDYSFTGINFNTLETTNRPEILNTTTFGNNGFTDYTRMSSNNGRWAIADELRVPTNADKKIHGRVSLPVGIDDSRPAWDDEAIVTVEVESPSGETTQEYTAKTVGDTNEAPGISIYGEEPRGGLFEIDLDEPLEVGSKVRISKVELTSGELTDGFEHQILTETVEVFPIIPPTPAQFSSSIIAQDSTTIQGMTDNLDAEVTATHNGEPLNTEAVKVDADGRFTLDLSEVSLEMDDEIQVFLRDAEGSALAAGVVNPPETNNPRGNINPSTELTFHDVTFQSATILTVGDLGPISPVDPLDPEVEVDPENKPELPEDQGQLSIDFVSSFNFGIQDISAHDQTYYAQPQRLLNEDGTVNESEERPNYVQISDRRSENDRNGWTLAVTQKEQFKGAENQVLNGASLSLSNQQVITAQGGTAPGLQSVPCTLIPGNRRTLLLAQGSEGTGTWIYRFGDRETAGESVALDIPRGTNPEATTYSSTLIWELSAVPDN
ncbi:WxL domain-containing protein [Enterococcus casseliflavus]|nr:WxL domain-containing protein [Enterococcus casseliflavus]